MPPNLKDDLFGLVKLYVPYLLLDESEKPDFDKFKFIRPFVEDHLPLTTELPL